MKIIGGHFALELPLSTEYHRNAIALNNGRNCLVYVLRAKQIRTLYIPNYICQSVVNTVESENVTIKYYDLNDDFSPKLQNFNFKSDEFVLLVNYFGLCEKIIDSLVMKTKNLIIDNTQAFFSPHRMDTDTFYSPRKFFGVPDGGYLYTDTMLNQSLDSDQSTSRFSHLVAYIEKSYEQTRPLYIRHEDSLDHLPLKKMSTLTSRILQSITYPSAINHRLNNLALYQTHLAKFNDLSVPDSILPIVYPLYLKGKGDDIRQTLKKKGIIVTRYWASAFERLAPNSFEDNLATDLIGLPIDQRYTDDDILYVCKTITSLL